MEINNFIIETKTNRTSIKELSHLFYHEKIIYNFENIVVSYLCFFFTILLIFIFLKSNRKDKKIKKEFITCIH